MLGPCLWYFASYQLRYSRQKCGQVDFHCPSLPFTLASQSSLLANVASLKIGNTTKWDEKNPGLSQALKPKSKNEGLSEISEYFAIMHVIQVGRYIEMIC